MRSHGVRIYYDFEIRSDVKPGTSLTSSVPEWMLGTLGVDFFHHVGGVILEPAALPTPQGNIDRCWALIRNLARVEQIRAYRDWITPEAILVIGEHSELRQLELRQQDLTAHDLAPLARLRSLEWLDLSETNIGDDAAAQLSSFPKLKILSLSKTRIGDKGAAEIARNRSLNWLRLDSTLVGNQSALEISKLKSLERLMLNNTKLTDVGLSHLANLPELQLLQIGGTQVTGSGFASFPADCKLTKINMRDCPVSDEGTLAIGRFRQLIDVYLGSAEPTSVTMKSLGAVEWPNSLEQVFLHGSGLTDEGLMRFVDCPKLWQISIKGTQVTPAGARQFRATRPTVNVVGP